MAKFTEGFLSSLRGAGQRGSATDPRLADQRAPQYGSTDPLARSVGGMLGMDMSTGAELAQKEIKAIPDKVGTMEHLKKMMLVQAKYAAPQEQALMFAKITEIEQAQAAKQAELAQQQAVREAAIKRARAAGLDGIADSFSAGQPLEEGLKLVREEEKRNLLVTKGKAGRTALLRQAGATQAEMDGMMGASEEEFLAFLKGNEGTIKAFKNAEGEIQSIKTNSYGRVWDEADQRWKNPSEMGVAPAPQVQEVYSRTNDLVKGMVDLGVKNFGELQAAADDAVDTLYNTQVALDLLDSPEGIYSGALGPTFKEFDKWAYALSGGNWDQTKAANSEAYVASRVKEVATQIKAFGTGTAVSDTDREYVEKSVAGNLTMSEEAIRSILRQGEEMANRVLKSHSDSVDRLAKEGVPRNILEILAVSQRYLPEPRQTNAPTLSAQSRALRESLGL